VGIAAAPLEPASVDWMAVRQRLQAVGATTFQIAQRPNNQWAFCLAMPTSVPGKVHRIEAEAATEAEAIAHALSEAERWRKGL
jgi:3-oxoacyl-(acyl-carrier-protein) synthase